MDHIHKLVFKYPFWFENACFSWNIYLINVFNHLATMKEKDKKADRLEKGSKLDQHLAEKRKPNAQRNRKSILSRKGWKVT